ncbi:zf-UBP-domain-containing protein [Rhizopogon vinicolor AM-OR11-026]|uniref:Zf-UBP-domain-containing protein n=1 Tax=Rhizopogon vinicolor AM-OR11-026 TaxID=1314800 RepID=A0A1B7N295_9AGAM|nr:zf-UBP-domain-containing protein [Rhizopogon vinicolor AM-OR11-026]
MIHGYHIRLALHRNIDVSQSNPHTADTFIPKTFFQQLPSHRPKQTARRNALFNPAHKDYRFGPIRLDWIDFGSASSAMYAGKEKEAGRGPSIAEFIPTTTESGSTNLPEGVVHVYRQCDERRQNGVDESKGRASASETISEDGFMLGVLAVPAWMTPSDFLAFVAPAAEGMAHLRLIRDSSPNRSIAVIKFRQADQSMEFAEAYNGKPFNSMDPETCHVVRVLSVEIDSDYSGSSAIARLPQSVYELPTCPVCLERMDSAVTGLITVPCSHTFHCMCLSKWGDSRCPVCRYSQTLLSSHPTSSTSRSRPIPFSNVATPSLSTCADCSSSTNLWICLICGNIGCGRYGRAHAHAHYEKTTHLYALELETQRVWDYAGDGYVHRLIQNKADGKLVELPSAASSMGVNSRDDGTLGPSDADSLSAEKIEAIGIEYSYLLTSQLDSQRLFYEEQTTELKTQVEELRNLVEKLGRDLEMDKAEAKEREAQRHLEEEEKLDEVYKDKIKAEKKAERVAELARKFEKELKEEKAVSEGLLRNLTKMKETSAQSEKQREEYEAKIAELQDQVRDIMFFLEAREKIEQGDGAIAEAAGGTVDLQPSSSTAAGAGNRKRKGKKT